MLKYLKFHFAYFLNKMVILTTSIMFLFAFIVFIIVASINKNSIYFNIIYFDTVLLFMRIVMVIVASFLAGEAFWVEKDQYRLFLIDSKNKRIPYVLTKISAILLIIALLYIIQVIFGLLIGIIFQNNFVIGVNQIEVLVWTYFIVILYGMYSSFFTILFQNSFMILFPMVLFLCRELIINYDEKMISNIVSIVLPNIYNDKGLYYLPFGIIHIIVLVLLVISSNVVAYYNKDLN